MRKHTNFREHKSRGIITKINQWILAEQKRLADYLNIKCQDISANGLMAFLITFSVIATAVLLRLIISAVL